jgi:hypothetical protein
MSVLFIGLSTDQFPMFRIGTLAGKLANSSDIEIDVPVPIVVNLSRINSMEKVGGFHLALSVHPAMSWRDATELKITGEHLAVLWKSVEREALDLLFPEMPPETRAILACATSSNSEFTAQRPDLHAHVQVATPEQWKRVRRMVDDARKPREIASEALGEAGIVGDEQIAILNKLYPVKEGGKK